MDASQKLWGPQTDLAVGNFPIARRPLDARIAKALARIKRHGPWSTPPSTSPA